MAGLTQDQRVNITILVAALGYFVDIFDIQLFAMLRVPSLKELGISGDALGTVGSMILNWQMAGMVVGGLLWGVLGDRKGRVFVLFGTILLYSLGNIANAFVTSIPEYAAARFFTGMGLAGEIGAGVTLASELLPKNLRNYGSTAIVTIGVIGPLFAGFMANALNWKTCYIVGGVLGLLLLALRVSVNESGLFHATKKEKVKQGHFWMLFTKRKRFTRYALCILSGLPIWFVVGTIVIFAPEIGEAMHVSEPVKASNALISCYIGLSLGGLISGILSQIFKNRRLVSGTFILSTAAIAHLIFALHGLDVEAFYGLIIIAGTCIGYWNLFMSNTAEQFGTNLRNTASSSAANFVRASTIINSMIIAALKPILGAVPSMAIVGSVICIIAAFAVLKMPESFGKDLDYVER